MGSPSFLALPQYYLPYPGPLCLNVGNFFNSETKLSTKHWKMDKILKILIVMLNFGPEPKIWMKQICGHHRKERCIKYWGYLDFRFVWNIIGTRTLGCRQMSEGQMREQKGGNAPPEKERRVIWTTIGVLCKNKMKMTHQRSKKRRDMLTSFLYICKNVS